MISVAEKEGTFTNTERRVQLVRKAISPIGDAKSDCWIVCEIAKKMGVRGFEFKGPEEIMEEISSCTLQYGGISHERLEKESLQWPCPDKNHPGTKYLHHGKFASASGKGKFMPLTSRRGKVEARAFVTDLCLDGVINMTFHFSEAPTNVLTNSAVDPVAKIPETKVCAVNIQKK